MTKGANTSVSLCSVTVCHCETTPTLSAGSEEAEKLHTDTLPRCRTKFSTDTNKTRKSIVFNGWVLRYLSSIGLPCNTTFT